MKSILKYLKEFYHQTFDWTFYGTWVLFLALLIFINYRWNLEDGWLESYSCTPTYYPLTFIWYGTPIVITVLLLFLFKKVSIRQPLHFWGLLLFTITILMFNESFCGYKDLIIAKYGHDEHLSYWLKRCANNLVSNSIYFIPVIAYWFFYRIKGEPLYGFSAKKFDFTPYLLMMGIMFPLILLAATQSDFLSAYPSYKKNEAYLSLNLPEWITIVIFEICYSIDFIGLEFFFRGFMVLAFMRFLGPYAVFPMVSLYCLYHFGKPLGETISSVFGGYLLGVIAYYSRSIYGGIIIHLGIALTMEMVAFYVNWG